MQGAVEHAAPIEAHSLLATGTDGLLATGTDGASLREVVAQRVAAHRNRRAGAEAVEAAREAALRHERDLLTRENRRGVSKVRDTVRARYENSQSYREFLAAEAERALQQAQAEAEIAARNAQAIADAQIQLLEEMQQWEQPDPSPRQQARSELAHELAGIALGARELIAEPPALSIFEAPEPARPGDLFAEPAESQHRPLTEVSAAGLTVRLYEDLGPARSLPQRGTEHSAQYGAQRDTQRGARFKDNDRRRFTDTEDTADELAELEQEIAFRRAPEFVNHILEALPIPANLIEFPRQLIASRKARPRLAEGPLREETAPQPQLRIFEVEPEQISVQPTLPDESATADGPDWQGLLLDTTPAAHLLSASSRSPNAYLNAYPNPYPGAHPATIASISRRLMAAAVDGCCILAAFAAFSTIVAYIAGPGLQTLPRPLLAAAAAMVLAASYLIYQALFFTFADATPGMLYARIGFCTFSDENPTRKAMRRRILATALAACPLGLGLLWVWMDDDRLGWHDRISRMYQRAY
jgi:uncharacterized RDD family membrane protein YckC